MRRPEARGRPAKEQHRDADRALIVRVRAGCRSRVTPLGIDGPPRIRGQIAIPLDAYIVAGVSILDHNAPESRQGRMGSPRATLLIILV